MNDVDAWVEANWDPELTVRTWWRRLADAGYAHPAWPPGAGGLGLRPVEARAVTAALAAHGVVAPPTGHLGAALAAPTIIEHGTSEQIRELVLPIARGEAAWCQLFSEPGAGSDLASLATRAVRDGDEWVVSGQKVWNSSAHLADMGMLLARTDPAAPKHHGITYFAVDMHQPGVEVRPLRVMNGTAPFCEVFLDGARVPSHRVIGDVDDGWRVAKTTMRHERATVAGGGFAGLVPARAGSVDSDLDRTCREVLERAAAAGRDRQSPIRAGAVPARAMLDLARTHGRAADPVIRQALARYWTHVKVNGWTMRRSAGAGGRLTAADGSIAKLTTARICQESMQLSYRIAGPALLLAGPESPFGGDLQSVNLASPGNRIGGGTDEVQLNALGERALGLPRDQLD
jgi:alkylation response protein AidB-like acyl-CoA dehydrogenase